MSKMTWIKDYPGHFTAAGAEHIYTLSSNRGSGWSLTVLDRITEMSLGSHTESRKTAAMAIADSYEQADDAAQAQMMREFRP